MYVLDINEPDGQQHSVLPMRFVIQFVDGPHTKLSDL